MSEECEDSGGDFFLSHHLPSHHKIRCHSLQFIDRKNLKFKHVKLKSSCTTNKIKIDIVCSDFSEMGFGATKKKDKLKTHVVNLIRKIIANDDMLNACPYEYKANVYTKNTYDLSKWKPIYADKPEVDEHGTSTHTDPKTGRIHTKWLL